MATTEKMAVYFFYIFYPFGCFLVQWNSQGWLGFILYRAVMLLYDALYGYKKMAIYRCVVFLIITAIRIKVFCVSMFFSIVSLLVIIFDVSETKHAVYSLLHTSTSAVFYTW